MGFHTSDQHKEVSHARKERDKKDITSILSFVTDRNPFLDDPSLRNIDTAQQVITLSTKTSIIIDGEPIQVDPQLRFQRLTTTANTLFEDPSDIFKYVVFHLLFLIQAVFLGKHTSLLWQMQSGALGTVVLRNG